MFEKVRRSLKYNSIFFLSTNIYIQWTPIPITLPRLRCACRINIISHLIPTPKTSSVRYLTCALQKKTNFEKKSQTKIVKYGYTLASERERHSQVCSIYMCVSCHAPTCTNSMNTLLCMYVHMFVCMYICLYVCTYVCMYVHMFVCMYICLYVCTYVCMYVHMFVCMYIMFVCIYLVCMCVHFILYATHLCTIHHIHLFVVFIIPGADSYPFTIIYSHFPHLVFL